MMAEEKKANEAGQTDGSGLVSSHLSTPSARSSTNCDDNSSTETSRSKNSKKTNRPSTSSGINRPHSSKTTRKNELISENCRKFNRLYHCSSGSEDSASSSDTVLEITKGQAPVALNRRNSRTGTIDSSSKLAVNPSTHYFNHDSVHSPFKPTASTSMISCKHSPVKNLNKNVTHGISQLIKAAASGAESLETKPTIKLEIKQENQADGEGNGNHNRKTANETSIPPNQEAKQIDIKKEVDAENSWCEGDQEMEVQAETVSAPQSNNSSSIMNTSEDGVSAGQENEEDMDVSENGSGSKIQDEGKKTAKRMDKESKKLMMQLTDNEKRKSSRLVSKTTFCNKKHEAQTMKRLKQIIKKPNEELTPEERQLKEAFPNLVRTVKKRLESRKLASERLKEIEDSPEELEIKCTKLAKVIKNAKYLVVYTGAGISTSASIPDYRGPNGIWTKLRNGESLDAQSPTVLTTADPTLTHMAIQKLHSERIIKHIVSQNCDGLHLRSGIPKNALSEVHGNMYIEVCTKCSLEYVRNFDVTENTRRYEHRTGRHCYFCGTQLRDTVVHFGERGSLRWPLNWAGAEYNVARADVILCLGSSLKVLRRYPWLWGMDLPVNKRPKLYIVNLQWTPKDQFAALKIHGKCDEVMSKVMSKLNILIPSYERETDQIFALATPLHESEEHSKSSTELVFPPDKTWPTNPPDLNNYTRFEPRFIPADLKIKKDDDDLAAQVEKLGKCDSRILRSQLKAKLEESKKNLKKSPLRKKRDRNTIIKGNGNGWFGNAWGKSAIKAKKRKASTNKQNEGIAVAAVVAGSKSPEVEEEKLKLEM